MEAIQFVSEVQTPLALAAVLIIALSGVYLAVVRKHKGKVISDAVRNLFRLAILAIVASMAIYLFLEYRKTKVEPERLEDLIVQINVRNAPFEDVLQDIARQIGAVTAIGQLEGTISMDANGTAAEVLNELCRAKSCQWQILSREGQKPALFVNPLNSAPTK